MNSHTNGNTHDNTNLVDHIQLSDTHINNNGWGRLLTSASTYVHIVFWAFLLAILKHHLPFDMYTTLNNANTEIRGGRFRQTGMTGGNIIVGAVLVSSLSRELIVDILLYFVLVTKTSFSLQKKGILSGKYIFEEPLQHYWAEKRAEELAAMKGEVQQISTTSGVSNAQTPKSK